jgi:hypothetical protein|tara:strand:- start:61 stop:189 length:129 start_codon:yes stop_codon:yes gene_type:complete
MSDLILSLQAAINELDETKDYKAVRVLKRAIEQAKKIGSILK